MMKPRMQLWLWVLVALSTVRAFGAGALVAVDVTVGQNLETEASIALEGVPPQNPSPITLTSTDPTRMLLSKSVSDAGAPSITMMIQSGHVRTQEFFVQGLVSQGVVTYTASSPGYATVTGAVTLMPSGIIVSGPGRPGAPFQMTPRAWPAKITIYSALLDSAHKFVGVQLVRGGFSVNPNVTSSNAAVGSIAESHVTIAGGSFSATTEFKPAGIGTTSISVGVPSGFSPANKFDTVTATVTAPGLGIVDQTTIGQNLQLGGTLLLGEPAPPGGLKVTLTSSNPAELVLSASGAELGSGSITLEVPPGARSIPYYLQALAGSGIVTYEASAPGYSSRKATLTLAPSGVIITGPTGLPDEGEFLQPAAPVAPHGFFTNLAGRTNTPIVLYTVFLDPKTHRAADITAEGLRAGISITVDVKNSNPDVGIVGSPVTIIGGCSQGATQFTPIGVGSASLSVVTPKGFTTPSNATSLEAVVRP